MEWDGEGADPALPPVLPAQESRLPETGSRLPPELLPASRPSAQGSVRPGQARRPTTRGFSEPQLCPSSHPESY